MPLPARAGALARGQSCAGQRVALPTGKIQDPGTDTNTLADTDTEARVCTDLHTSTRTATHKEGHTNAHRSRGHAEAHTHLPGPPTAVCSWPHRWGEVFFPREGLLESGGWKM